MEMSLFSITRICFWGVLFATQLPIYGTISGKNREEIVAAFGPPTSALNSSSREILNYPQGKIVLTEGVVSSYQGVFHMDEAPSPSKATATVAKPEATQPAPPPVTSPSPEAPAERRSIQPFRWSHTLAEAQARSVKDKRPILALFTGPDWCGPCQQLEAEVLSSAEFRRLGRKRYIPLKIALYRNSYQAPQAKAEYNRLSAQYNIQGVPNFVILDAEGTLTARPDLFKRRKGVTNLQEQVFAAIEEAENGGGGIGLYAKVGIAAVIAGIAFIFLRK